MKDVKMKRFKPLLILLLVCFLLERAAYMAYPSFFHTGSPPDRNLTTFAVIYLRLLSPFVWIPVAMWVLKDSKKHLFLPWLWALLIMVLKVEGVLVYLLVQILTKSKDADSI